MAEDRAEDDADEFDDEEDVRPMTEEEWEKMMRESDLKAARFGELLETFHEDPNCHQIVAREMGWHDFADALEAQAADEAAQDEGDSEEADTDEEDDAFAIDEIEQAEASARGDDTDPFPEDEDEREVKKIPAYAISDRAAEAVREALKPYERGEQADEDIGDLIGQAWIGIHISCAKISGGHAMGYDDDVLCGNIVNNKRALDGAQQSIGAFEELKTRGVLPAALVDGIMPMLREAEQAIQARIAELRSKVWW